jgi:hypothetical protein
VLDFALLVLYAMTHPNGADVRRALGISEST